MCLLFEGMMNNVVGEGMKEGGTNERQVNPIEPGDLKCLNRARIGKKIRTENNLRISGITIKPGR